MQKCSPRWNGSSNVTDETQQRHLGEEERTVRERHYMFAGDNGWVAWSTHSANDGIETIAYLWLSVSHAEKPEALGRQLVPSR